MSLKEAREQAQAAAERLRQLGFDVPEMPEDNRFQTVLCSACGGRGKRAANGGEPLRCWECSGTGVTVIAPLVEWNRKVASMLEKAKIRG